MRTERNLLTFLQAVKVLKDTSPEKLAENEQLLADIKNTFSGKNMSAILGKIQQDYQMDRNAAFNRTAGRSSSLTPESPEFLHAFARFKSAAHDIYAGDNPEIRYTENIGLKGAMAFNSSNTAEKMAAATAVIKGLRETREFEEVYNSVFSDKSLQIGTINDPTRIGSYIDYSPYIWNYRYYLSIPTLSQTVDRSIQIATRELPDIEFEDTELSELLVKVLKRSRFEEKLRKMLLFSHLSPRGALIVPIENGDGTIRFNIFNDTQFTYASGYQYTRLDFRDEESDGVRQIFALGHLLMNGVTAHFLCPGFEPIYAIGKNRLFQLKDAAEAVNIYLYTIKVLCIRAQILVQKWGGEGQNDTLLEQMQRLTEDINSSLSLSTSIDLPDGADLTILNNNLSEGFAKVSPIIKEYQGMLSGVMPDYFYGSDTAYSANSFNIHATHQNIRSEIQEAQIEPIVRFMVNKYLQTDVRFAKWKDRIDDFDITFKSLYEPTDMEKAEIESKRINNLITMAGYPELTETFKKEGLLDLSHEIPSVGRESPT